MTSDLTLYQYYGDDYIETGLSDATTNFTLNNKDITIFSGALHYFRVPPPYWSDRLRKMRAAGLNCIETYIPWNLHEPYPSRYDFGDGIGDYSEFLNLRLFLQTAKHEDLFVIIRPGPYICAEWEFGGLPSWLLRYTNIKVRTSDPIFMQFVQKYFKKLLEILAPEQFTKGGPIIAFQIENEYGNTKNGDEPIDIEYLKQLEEILKSNGIVELLFTSDTPSNGFCGTIPGVLATANFQNDPIKELTLLKKFQPNKPLMVMEYWTGWFDHWAEKHHTRDSNIFGEILEEIIKLNASVNMYMFHGGTNWGFLNGANIADSSTDNKTFQPDTSSYDYDAPLSEAGDYTEKYFKVKEIIMKYNTNQTKLPPMPDLNPRIAYDPIEITEQLSLENLMTQLRYKESSEKLISMEFLNCNYNAGQSYGYIIYRKTHLDIDANSILKIEGRVCDSVMVLINGELISKVLNTHSDLNEFGYWRLKDSTLSLGEAEYKNATLDLVVENWGRCNYGKLDQFQQFKGLWQGNVLINDTVLTHFEIFPMEFDTNWISRLKDWRPYDNSVGPALYKGTLILHHRQDTFIDLRQWTKGIIIVNGLVLSRYLKLGPQLTAYLPGELLELGTNEILIFEHFVPNNCITFLTDPIFSN